MRAIAMSLEGGEEVEEDKRFGSREELLSIKGELLTNAATNMTIMSEGVKCSDDPKKEMLVSSLGHEVDEDGELLHRESYFSNQTITFNFSDDKEA